MNCILLVAYVTKRTTKAFFFFQKNIYIVPESSHGHLLRSSAFSDWFFPACTGVQYGLPRRSNLHVFFYTAQEFKLLDFHTQNRRHMIKGHYITFIQISITLPELLAVIYIKPNTKPLCQFHLPLYVQAEGFKRIQLYNSYFFKKDIYIYIYIFIRVINLSYEEVLQVYYKFKFVLACIASLNSSLNGTKL